jgi:hypothetical protein
MPDYFTYGFDSAVTVQNSGTLYVTYTVQTNATTAVADDCYYAWPTTTTNIYATGTYYDGWGQTYWPTYEPYEPPVLTPAEQRRAEVERRCWERAAAVARRKRGRAHLTAQQKAERILLQHLTPEQRDEYQRLQRFSVIGPDGHIYRINRGRSGNVQLIEETEEGVIGVEQFCIHPIEYVPDEDNMLAQKLLIESDLASFRRIANISHLGRMRLVS